jgi:hypothetical protein
MKGWIYFLQFGNEGPIKVGRSSDPGARAQELNVASPVELVLLGAMRTTNAVCEERTLHERLAAFYVRGEWFERAAVLAEMKRLAGRIVRRVELPVSGLRMAAIRADKKTLASWARKAKAAGMSLNKWACIVLNNAPAVRPATIVVTEPKCA